MSRQQSPIKEIWGKVIYLLAITLTGLFYGVIIMVPLMMLLGLDSVDEFVNPPITLFFLWIICTVGWHLYLKGQEKRRCRNNLIN